MRTLDDWADELHEIDHRADVMRTVQAIQEDAAESLRADLAEQLPMRDADAFTIGNLNAAIAERDTCIAELKEERVKDVQSIIDLQCRLSDIGSKLRAAQRILDQ
jgi:hypothetical protein